MCFKLPTRNETPTINNIEMRSMKVLPSGWFRFTSKYKKNKYINKG